MFLETIKSAVWLEIEHKSLYNKILDGHSIHLKGLPGALKSIFLALLLERIQRPLLSVFPTQEEAELVAEEISFLIGEEEVAFFPGSEEYEEGSILLAPRRSGVQMEVLRDLIFKKIKVVTTSAIGIIQKLPNPDIMKQTCISVSVGTQFDLYELVENLIKYGYVRESMVERPGEISLRGGILDIFPYTGEEPQRIEFFGDRVESIRRIDVETQRSIGMCGLLKIVPSTTSWKDRTSILCDYFKSEHLLFLEDKELILAEVEKEFQRGKQSILRPNEVEAFFKARQSLFYSTFSTPEGVIDFNGKGIRKLGRTLTEIRENLSILCSTDIEFFLMCENKYQADRVKELLGQNEDPIPGLKIGEGPIRRGFIFPSAKLAMYSENDIFGRIYRQRKKKRFHLGEPIRELSSLRPGDFVVHIDHGIGQYISLEKISIRGIPRECLAILYKDEDKLYVPIDKMERIQKYASRDNTKPELTKLGGQKWERLKSKTKQSILEIAKDLVAIYSIRQTYPGHAFSPDSPWQRELESTFIYEETPDQTKAIEEVKHDMEKPRPMDRLVCGDVGYGKTEVAIRAAFKSVTDDKQVAVLVPTTILAQQHYQTFRRRLDQFPVTVEVLSRFKSRKEQQEIIEKTKLGGVDILIGTHRLLSKDVGFKDLGLLIIDEEQRFGVRHKERLKAFRKTIDVLTLSATPIPRTLHFSMMGIRDMSVINTPPKDRLPIITEVLPFSDEVVVEAIQRELIRGGQIFFVHNRIKSIYTVARMIRRLVPSIRLAVAHGQMLEHDLEKVMLEFVEGEYDCLVSTTIIESGLDLPNVNTLLINRADQMGLAQLYQLRGRVGRSGQRAYAFLFTPPFQHLSQEAVKRLRTIEEFTELGSGFQIALRDLEIRGTGNLLGVEQSGYMDAIGFDLYMKLVEEAVEELKGKGEEKEGNVRTIEEECRIDAELPAYLPDTYVSDENVRVNLYRRLSSIRRSSEVDLFTEELKDRFGNLPKEAENLMNVVMLRIFGKTRGLKQIIIKDQTIKMFFSERWMENFIVPEQLSNHLRSIIDFSSVPIRFTHEGGFGFIVHIQEKAILAFAKKLLQNWR